MVTAMATVTVMAQFKPDSGVGNPQASRVSAGTLTGG
jgi:hypothetical protein